MIHILHIGTTLLAYSRIDSREGVSRRLCERAAVTAIIRHLYGCRHTLGHDSGGAPLLTGEGAPFISVSHSRDLAVVAVDPTRRVGVDAETWRSALCRTAQRFLTEAELPFCTTPDTLLRAWTIKEAVYKAALVKSPDLRDIRVSPALDAAETCGATFKVATLVIGEDAVSLAF